MKGIILTWEEGEALRSLTENRCLSLLPIANRSLLELQMELLFGCGVEEVFVVAREGHEEELWGPLGPGKGARWHTVGNLNKSPLEALLATIATDEPVVVVASPFLADLDLGRAVAFHRQLAAKATLLLQGLGEEVVPGSLVLTDEQGRVARVLPKPQAGGQLAHTMGSLFVVAGELAPELVPLLVGGGEEALRRFLLALGGAVYGYPWEGYWLPIRTLGNYLQANWDVLTGRIKQTKPLGQERAPGVWVGKETEISSTARLEGPVVVGNGVQIGPGARVSHTVLGAGVCIEDDALITNSILLENCYVGKGVAASGVILGEDSIINKGATLHPGMVIAPHSVIGRHSCLGCGFDLEG